MDIRNLGWIVTLAAFSTISCGDAVPPPAEGAASFTLTQSSSTNGICVAHTLNLIGGDTPPSPSDTGTLLVDGHDGASVSCKVKGNGTYAISGHIGHGDTTLSISGTFSDSTGTGTATVSFWDSVNVTTLSDSNCEVRIGTGSYAVTSGAIWANIRCTQLVSGDNAYWCDGNGTIVLKSCDE